MLLNVAVPQSAEFIWTISKITADQAESGSWSECCLQTEPKKEKKKKNGMKCEKIGWKFQGEHVTVSKQLQDSGILEPGVIYSRKNSW